MKKFICSILITYLFLLSTALPSLAQTSLVYPPLNVGYNKVTHLKFTEAEKNAGYIDFSGNVAISQSFIEGGGMTLTRLGKHDDSAIRAPWVPLPNTVNFTDNPEDSYYLELTYHGTQKTSELFRLFLYSSATVPPVVIRANATSIEFYWNTNSIDSNRLFAKIASRPDAETKIGILHDLTNATIYTYVNGEYLGTHRAPDGTEYPGFKADEGTLSNVINEAKIKIGGSFSESVLFKEFVTYQGNEYESLPLSVPDGINFNVNSISEAKAKGSVTISANVVNNNNEIDNDKEAILIVAAYDSTGKLLKLTNELGVFPADSHNELTTSIEIDTDVSEVKSFIWEDFNALKPIVEMASLN